MPIFFFFFGPYSSRPRDSIPVTCYFLAKALEALVLMLHDRGFLPTVPHGYFLMYTAAGNLSIATNNDNNKKQIKNDINPLSHTENYPMNLLHSRASTLPQFVFTFQLTSLSLFPPIVLLFSICFLRFFYFFFWWWWWWWWSQ